MFARVGIANVYTGVIGGGFIPFTQTVSAEIREYHQVDILHIFALVQMREQTPKSSGV